MTGKQHELGLRGQFAIPQNLQDTALAWGLQIQKIGADQYRLFAGSAAALDNISPDFAEGRSVFDLQSLERFLEFLHQPLKNSTQGNSKEDSNEQRLLMHRLLRFAATGSVQIPATDGTPRPKYLEDDDHVEVENAMKAEDIWRHGTELDQIPGAARNAGEGLFVFKIDGTSGDAKNPERQELGDILQRCFDAAEPDKTQTPENHSIHLTATGLQRFCVEAVTAADTIKKLSEKIEFTEHVEAALGSINRHSEDAAFTLENLRQAASAMHPVITSDSMNALWKRYHFSSRKNSPLPRIARENEVLQAVLDHYNSRGDITAAEMESVTREFLPFLAFSKGILSALGQTDIAGTLPKEESPDPDHKKVLSVLRKSLGQAGSPLSQAWEAAAGTTKNFFSDMYSFMRESPKMAVSVILIAGVLYWMRGAGTPAVAKAVTDSVMVFGDEGLKQVAINPDSLSDAARQVRDWHYDMGLLGLYKHYMYNNAVIGPAQTILDSTRSVIHWAYHETGIPQNFNSHFSKAAEETVKPVANALFKVNLFQNFTHAGFWVYMFGRGVEHGFKGGEKIVNLFAPLADLGYAAGTKTLETVGLRKPPAPLQQETAGGYKPPPEKISCKKAWLAAAGITAGAVCAASVGLDMAGQSHALTDLVSTFSGHAAATAVTGSTFLVYNFVEDIFLNHFTGGAALLTAGTACHYAFRKVARPVMNAIAEKGSLISLNLESPLRNHSRFLPVPDNQPFLNK